MQRANIFRLRQILAQIKEQSSQTKRPECENCVISNLCDRCKKDVPERLRVVWAKEDVEIAAYRERRQKEEERASKRLSEALRRSRGESPIY